MSGEMESNSKTKSIDVEITGAASFGDDGLVLSKELLAKICVSSKIPPKVIVDGDRIAVVNSARYAIEEFQKAMKGKAERLGIKTEEEVFELFSRWRHEEE